MQLAKIYVQTFKTAPTVYFFATHYAKNGSAMGYLVTDTPGPKAKSSSVPPSFWGLWTRSPENVTPPTVLAAFRARK